MYGNDRSQLRQVFFDAWRKHREGLPLSGIELRLVDVMLQHPEYHAVLDDRARYLDHDWPPEQGESNPFMHLSMHVSLEEQLAIGSPAGIIDHFKRILSVTDDRHTALHQMMDCLGEAIWKAQRHETSNIEQTYLECLQTLGRK